MPDDDSNGDERSGEAGDDHRTGSSIDEILGAISERSDDEGAEEGGLRSLADLLEGDGTDSSLDDLLGEMEARRRSKGDRGGRSSSGRETAPDEWGGGPSARPKIDRDTIRDATDVLVLESAGGSSADHACTPFFAMEPPERQNALFISLTGAVDDSIGVLRQAGPQLPANVGIISVNEKVRSTTRASLAEYDMDTVTINVISNPSDLARLGLTISKVISPWEDTGKQLTVCFRSLTALLQYAELESVFRFLHVLQGRFSAANAVAHYHMEADAHDQQTVATLRTLFDVVIEVEPDGGFEVAKG